MAKQMAKAPHSGRSGAPPLGAWIEITIAKQTCYTSSVDLNRNLIKYCFKSKIKVL